MEINERMETFIDSLDKGNTPFLDTIEKYALETEVPIIRKSTQSFLKFLLAYAKPKHILEVGTAIGFSAGASSFADTDSVVVSFFSLTSSLVTTALGSSFLGVGLMLSVLTGD